MEQEAQSYFKVVKVCGMEEDALREKISDLLKEREKLEVSLAFRAGDACIRIASRLGEQEKAKSQVKAVVRELKIRLGSSIYTTDPKTTLEEAVVQLLKEQDRTAATVESCTGGLVSGRLTNVSGASQVFKQGFVTYSNKAKRRFAGVKKATLKKYTAVSAQTAKEMARGGLLLAGADFCVSVTGYAGPEGGADGEPAGLVYLGCSRKGKTVTEEHHFSGSRSQVREQAVVYALSLLRTCILESYRI